MNWVAQNANRTPLARFAITLARTCLEVATWPIQPSDQVSKQDCATTQTSIVRHTSGNTNSSQGGTDAS